MFQADKIKLILLNEFTKAQLRNPSYSMRALSKRVKVSQAAISQILSGKRSLTKKTAEKILAGLDVSPLEIESILQASSDSQPTFKPLDMDSYHLIADWYYYAILSLAETRDFKGTSKWIAKRLGITDSLARTAIERLTRLELLIVDPETQKLKATGEQFEALSTVADPALKKACRQNIELAQKALEETEFNERDFTAITICFDPEKMADAKVLIKNFRRNFAKLMEANTKKEVYKLSIQLFPITKRSSL